MRRKREFITVVGGMAASWLACRARPGRRQCDGSGYFSARLKTTQRRNGASKDLRRGFERRAGSRTIISIWTISFARRRP